MEQKTETSYKVILFKPFHSAIHQLMKHEELFPHEFLIPDQNLSLPLSS